MRLHVAHASLEYKDSDRQHTQDIEKIFDRAVDKGYAWLTGTEAGPGSGNIGEELIRVSRDFGYVPWVPQIQGDRDARRTDCWIAVRKDLIQGKLHGDFIPVIPGSTELKRKVDARWGPKGVVCVNFESTISVLGEVNIGAAHYIHDAHNPSEQPEWDLNKQLSDGIVEWAKDAGRGSAIVFFGADSNMHDDKNDRPEGDPFFGGSMSTVWDELKHYENTGHGTIDVIATYNRDRRVTALQAKALSDREFHLHGDHFLIEAVLNVAPRQR